MTREQRVRDLIAIWQPRLGLQAWDIRYVDEPFPNKKDKHRLAACIYKELHSKVAQIFIAQDTLDVDLEGSVLHELLHVVLTDIEEMTLTAAGATGSTALMDLTHTRMERLIEDLIFAMLGRRFVPLSVRKKAMFSAFRDAA